MQIDSKQVQETYIFKYYKPMEQKICIALQVKGKFKEMTPWIFLKVLESVTVSALSWKRIPNVT